ncbi:MAG TPA: CoA-transferase [Dehalococcoidales bacterium]
MIEFGNKLLPLKEAVSKYVQPGIQIHLAGGIGGPAAAICEIIRQFHGSKPEFTLIQSTIAGHAINLLHCGLVKKVIFSACVDLSPASRPSRVMQEKWAEKKIIFENWSLCSLQERLLAGAMGINFIPTRSIAGSSLARDNQSGFKEILDPFGEQEKAALVRCLNPDLSIVHAYAADIQGNAILAIPYGDDIWGSLASSNGVLITAEKIVSAEVIQKHSALVKIPGHLVLAVCETPLGLHPFSIANPGVDNSTGYESDTKFLREMHEASLNDKHLDAWLQEWVLDCQDHQSYLNKLSNERIDSLRKIIGVPIGLSSVLPRPNSDSAYNSEQMMLTAAAREIVKAVLKSNHKLVLLGAGSRSIAVLLADRQLRSKGYSLEIITGNGQYGYHPSPSELALQSLTGVYSSKMVMDTIVSQGILIGGKNNRCLGVIGAGQIDRYGNTNSTLTSGGRFLVGSGGANDVGNAREVVVIINQSKDRFSQSLPYLTCRGERVTTVISNLAIFKKPVGGEELVLSACLPDPSALRLEERLKRAVSECGWPMKIADNVEDLTAPTNEELDWLRSSSPVV